jgi:hypothetical protein
MMDDHGLPIRFKGGLTPEQLEHYQDLKAEHEELQHQCRLVGDAEREWRIEPELARVEAELDYIHFDLVYFGRWLQDGQKQRSRRGRSADPKIVWRDKRIAAHSLLLKAEGVRGKTALASIMELYRVSRSTALEARKYWSPQLKKLGYDGVPPRERQLRLETLENLERRRRLWESK